MNEARHVWAYVPITRADGKVRKEKMSVGEIHRTCRLGKASRSDLRAAILREFHVTGRVVPPWRVQELADGINAKRFADALLDEYDIPF